MAKGSAVRIELFEHTQQVLLWFQYHKFEYITYKAQINAKMRGSLYCVILEQFYVFLTIITITFTSFKQ